jgi:hypothetical protein
MTKTNETRELNLNELVSVSGGAIDGISYLVHVTQMKASNANDDAMAGALAGALGGAGIKGTSRKIG